MPRAAPIAELGDIRALVDGGADEPAATLHVESASAAALRNRVRPKPAFVVRTVLLSIVSAAALVLLVLGLADVLSIGTGVLVGLAAVFGLTLGVVTADALRQETSSSHPLPTGRAIAFGASTGVLLAGLAFTAVVIVRLDLAWIILSALLVVAAIGVLSWLGATQTNRHKPWLVEQQRAMRTGNRFEEDPAVGRAIRHLHRRHLDRRVRRRRRPRLHGRLALGARRAHRRLRRDAHHARAHAVRRRLEQEGLSRIRRLADAAGAPSSPGRRARRGFWPAPRMIGHSREW